MIVRSKLVREARDAIAAMAAVATLLVLSIAHVLPHEGRHGPSGFDALLAEHICDSGKAESGSPHHAHVHAGTAHDGGDEPECPYGAPCPLCTLGKAFLFSGALAPPFRTDFATPDPQPEGSGPALLLLVAYLPQQPRAPPAAA